MLETLAQLFEQIVNNFYKPGISVSLTDNPGTAYCVGDSITLPKSLLEEFTNQKLPRFTVLYHELGHALYSENLSTLINRWENLPTNNSSLKFNEKYMHLLNWIEDYYIEDKLKQDYPFLTDLLGCLKRLTLPYDIEELDKAFNHYYVKGHASISLSAADAYTFTNYIKQLLDLRKGYNFGRGPISLLSTKSKETTFIKTIVDFYNFCVAKNIFTDNQKLPPLANPNMVINNSGNGLGNSVDNTTHNPQRNSQGNPNQTVDDDSQGGGSVTSDHTHLVGTMATLPQFDEQETALFHDQFVSEQKLIKETIYKQQQIESVEESLDGLFNNLFKDTSIIQSKVIVPNFFNPNRLVDQVLFKAPSRSFNNVSIYRDISGSTVGHTFKLINSICDYLHKKIPIAYNFYLYSSGDISILQTSYEYWEEYRDTPEVYDDDPIFNQFEGGTNSDAIADVISEQLNDKWLNIIITDGDLHSLMRRENINSLLENVFVISVEESSNLKDCKHKIIVKSEESIPEIIPAILNMRSYVS